MPPTYTTATAPSSSLRPTPERVRALHATMRTTSTTTTSATTPESRHSRGLFMGTHLPLPQRPGARHNIAHLARTCPGASPYAPDTVLHRPRHVHLLCVGLRDGSAGNIAGNINGATTGNNEWAAPSWHVVTTPMLPRLPVPLPRDTPLHPA